MTATSTKLRARVTQEDSRTLVRFPRKPDAAVRAYLKAQGAQFVGPLGARALPKAVQA